MNHIESCRFGNTSFTPVEGLQVNTLIGPLSVESIRSMQLPRSSSPASKDVPLGAEIIIIDFVGSCLFIVLQMF